jgi:hypothetical protein
MIKVSTFLRECLNEIEMKKYLPPYERELTSFPQRSSESLCSMDGTCTTPHALARTEMFQGKKKKIWLVALLRSNPPAPMEEPSCTTAASGEGWDCSVSRIFIFIFIIFIIFIFYFLETLQFPCPHAGAVVHDGSSVGAGGLQCDRATSQRRGRGGIDFF